MESARRPSGPMGPPTDRAAHTSAGGSPSAWPLDVRTPAGARGRLPPIEHVSAWLSSLDDEAAAGLYALVVTQAAACRTRLDRAQQRGDHVARLRDSVNAALLEDAAATLLQRAFESARPTTIN